MIFRTAREVADHLFEMFADRGDSLYGESVTQTQHAGQCAALADAENASTTLTIAALLHDVGHLVVDDPDGKADSPRENQKHERVAATELGRWFPPAVTAPIALHVAAKRYLVATDPTYAAVLSPASVHSLRIQGGPMDAAEVAKFSRHRYAEDACRLRRWDDAAKVADLPVPPLDYYRERLESLVVFRSSDAAHCDAT